MSSLIIGIIIGVIFFIIMYIWSDFDELGLSLVVGILCGGMAWLLITSIQQDRQMLRDCMADGHKQYECMGMIQR